MTSMTKTEWAERDGKMIRVQVVETQLGQYGDRDGAQACAGWHAAEYERVIVRRGNAYGWTAVGQTSVDGGGL